MNEEFNLSEKIDNYFEIECLDSMADVQGDISKILKEFILKLKKVLDDEKEFCNKAGVIPSVHPRRVKEWIDKLAGKRLVEE